MAKYNSEVEVIQATIATFKDAPKLGYVYVGDVPAVIVPAYRHKDGSPGCAVGCHLSAADALRLDQIGKEKGTYLVDGLMCLDESKGILDAAFGPDISIGTLTSMQQAHDSCVKDVEYGKATSMTRQGRSDEQIDREGVVKFVNKLEEMLRNLTV